MRYRHREQVFFAWPAGLPAFARLIMAALPWLGLLLLLRPVIGVAPLRP